MDLYNFMHYSRSYYQPVAIRPALLNQQNALTIRLL